MPAIIPEQGYGLLEEVKLDPRDWRAGSISGSTRVLLREDGDYSDFLPVDEYQVGVYFDTLACVSFSALNCLECVCKVKGHTFNASDRFLARMSNTTKQGNYLSSVAESIRNDGVVSEDVWSYPRLQRTPVFTWEDFYKDIPIEVSQEGKSWASEWEVSHEWVPTDAQTLINMLPYGPIQVTVYAWPHPVDGIYPDDPTQSRNHAVMLYKAEDGKNWYIFDHYDNTKKKLVWDYKFGAAKRFSVTKKIPSMPTLNLPDDTLVQEVEKSGSFGLYLHGKIIIGEEGKLIASWLMRNKGAVAGKCVPIKLADWESVPHTDLHGNPL